MERIELLKALTGSHNYNLATEDSDKDYKIFVAPTFEDLYKGNQYKKNIVTNVVDKDIKDIRQLPSLLYKSNLAYLELLFSDEIDVHDERLYELIRLRDNIVKMNLPQLFKSTGGMFINRMKRIDHATEGTQHLVDKYGYNTKEAMHGFRSLYVLVRFAENNFSGMGYVLKHTANMRRYMLGIKNGDYGSKEEAVKYITYYHDTFFAPLKEEYCNQKPNEELKEYIDYLIMEVVKDYILNQSIAMEGN
ncbi:DNA polymerase beta superfamily protein [Peribacillus asahii]|uniref:DNA polymerase beta superfamily protein n=1 Tax=Peribacillus asahii TaxID=228899 RepID=UPI0037F83A97